MTTPEITKEILRLSSSDPTLWEDYKDWAEQTFRNELFRGEINSLNEIQKVPGVALTYGTPDGSKTPQFGVVLTGKNSDNFNERFAARTREANQGPLLQIRNHVRNVNTGIRSLSEIAKAEGADINAYVLGLLTNTGFNPRGGNPQTVPEQMLQAVRTLKQEKGEKLNVSPFPNPPQNTPRSPSGARTGVNSENMTRGSSQFAEEGQRRSLQDFLRNPVPDKGGIGGEITGIEVGPRIPEGMSTEEALERMKSNRRD